MIARFRAERLAAVQRLRQFKSEEFLADTVFTNKQQRARNASHREHAPQNIFDSLIPYETIKHKQVQETENRKQETEEKQNL